MYSKVVGLINLKFNKLKVAMLFNINFFELSVNRSNGASPKKNILLKKNLPTTGNRLCVQTSILEQNNFRVVSVHKSQEVALHVC